MGKVWPIVGELRYQLCWCNCVHISCMNPDTGWYRTGHNFQYQHFIIVHQGMFFQLCILTHVAKSFITTHCKLK